MKSLNTIALQPQKMNSRIEAIMCMDLAGKGTGDIARELDLTPQRISIIKTSPMYQDGLAKMSAALQSRFREKQTDRLISGDPVESCLKEAALEAARCKIELMQNGKSEFVKLAASGDILDRAGYRAHQEKTKVSIEITDRMANRFERALAYGRQSDALPGLASAEEEGETTASVRITRVESNG
jgi:hypothetical protein